tara:strand:+ start:2351 stop:2785 length:435 start_codon:yes stop_codon:yes gene_type:complete
MFGLLWGDAQRLPPLPPSSWRGHSLRQGNAKPWKRRGSAWMLLAIMCLTILVTGCVTAVSSGVGAAASVTGAYFDYLTSEKGEAVVVTPPLTDYAPEIMARAADEFEQLGPPCARDTIVADCSAAARLIMDYGTLRDKIRAAKD